MTILGSGSMVAQLAPEKLIDEYQMVVDPVALGRGRTMFEGIREMLKLKITQDAQHSRTAKFIFAYEAHMKERSVTHSTFVIERNYPAKPEQGVRGIF